MSSLYAVLQVDVAVSIFLFSFSFLHKDQNLAEILYG